jgi:hypothetical protein
MDRCVADERSGSIGDPLLAGENATVVHWLRSYQVM